MDRPGEMHTDMWREELSKQTQQRKDGPLCLAFLFHFPPILHICWSGELQPLHLLLQGRSDCEGPGSAARKNAVTLSETICEADEDGTKKGCYCNISSFTVLLKEEVLPHLSTDEPWGDVCVFGYRGFNSQASRMDQGLNVHTLRATAF